MLNDIVSIKHRQGKVGDKEYMDYIQGTIEKADIEIRVWTIQHRDRVKARRRFISKYKRVFKKLMEKQAS